MAAKKATAAVNLTRTTVMDAFKAFDSTGKESNASVLALGESHRAKLTLPELNTKTAPMATV
jgi:hypothetical protein